MTSCEVVLAYSHLANNKSKRNTHTLNNTQSFTSNYNCFIIIAKYATNDAGNFDNHISTTNFGPAALRNLLNDPRRAGGLTANTPHFMILLISI